MMTDLETRLRQLTEAQRIRLASKLKSQSAGTPDNTPARKQLVAYVVPAAPTEGALEGGRLRDEIRRILPDYMVPAQVVVLDDFPRTPNGKVDRNRLPALDSSEAHENVNAVAPRSDIEETLAAIWAQVLGREQIGVYDNFFDLGGDSILSIQIIAKANQQGIRLTPTQLFQHQTVAELAGVAKTDGAVVTAEQGAVVGDVPLTPIQSWFFDQGLPNRHHWNQTFLFEVPSYVDAAQLENVLVEMFKHHDALRLTFSRERGRWQQRHSTNTSGPSVEVVDLSDVPTALQADTIEERATAFQGTLSLADGPLLRCLLFDCGPKQGQRLLIVAHHLVIDGVSWRILLEDIEIAYRQLARGEARQFAPKTTSFRAWSHALRQHAQHESVRGELEYWLAPSDGPSTTLPLDLGSPEQNIKESEGMVIAVLSEEETEALLSDVPAVYNTQINDVLLTALMRTMTHWSGREDLLLELEGHGREDIAEGVDLSRTVGWFTTTYPVRLSMSGASSNRAPAAADLGTEIKSVKEQLRRVPNRGIGYGLLRYLSDDANVRQQMAQLPKPQALFNYLGQLDQAVSESHLFRFAKEPVGPFQSPTGSRAHAFEINTLVVNQQLRVEWTFSRNLHLEQTVQTLAEQFVANLAAIVEHCAAPNAGGYTPSDFAEVSLDQAELDALAAEFG